MTHLHEEIRIEAAVEYVWAPFCDTSRWNEWMPWGGCSGFRGSVDEVRTSYLARTMWREPASAKAAST